jgi:hypothetical protein
MSRPVESYRAVRRNDAFNRYRDAEPAPWHIYQIYVARLWQWVGPRSSKRLVNMAS